MEATKNNLFGGLYQELWRAMIPPAMTEVEVEFLVEIGKLRNGSSVLDLMCGYGRHSLELSKRGISVHAVDSSPDYIAEIDQKATSLLTTECIDIKEFEPNKTFDSVICLGNSLSSLSYEETSIFFQKVSHALRDAGTFVLNTWMLSEIVYAKVQSNEWLTVSKYKYLLENKFKLFPSRIETIHTIIDGTKVLDSRFDTDYILSIDQIDMLLRTNGLEIDEVYSTPRKKKFIIGDQHCYFVAKKIKRSPNRV